MREQTYYELLQVRDDADIETIKASYRRLSKKFHPDNTQTGDSEQFKKITQAFEILSHESNKANYDTDLSNVDVQYTSTVGHNNNSPKINFSFFKKIISILIVCTLQIIRLPIIVVTFLFNFLKLAIGLTIAWLLGKVFIYFLYWCYFSIISQINKSGWNHTYDIKLESFMNLLFPKTLNHYWEWILLAILAIIVAFMETKETII